MQTEVKILTIVHPYESKFHPEAKFCVLQNGVNHTIFQVLFYGFSSVSNNDSLSTFSVLGIIPGAGEMHRVLRAKGKNQVKWKREEIYILY